jgi:hypothetical protein
MTLKPIQLVSSADKYYFTDGSRLTAFTGQQEASTALCKHCHRCFALRSRRMAALQLGRHRLLQDGHQSSRIGRPKPGLLLLAHN